MAKPVRCTRGLENTTEEVIAFKKKTAIYLLKSSAQRIKQQAPAEQEGVGYRASEDYAGSLYSD
jgi:hypothetical protein